jgi:hypothetical protein
VCARRPFGVSLARMISSCSCSRSSPDELALKNSLSEEDHASVIVNTQVDGARVYGVVFVSLFFTGVVLLQSTRDNILLAIPHPW